MAVLGGLEVDGPVQVESPDNDTWPQVKVVVDDGNELVRGLLRGAVGVDVDGQGLSNANGIRQLDKRSPGEAGSNQGLGDPASDVGGGSVDLGEILAGEGATTVSTPTTVGVDDDLAASQTSISLGSANDEKAGGLDLCGVMSVG